MFAVHCRIKPGGALNVFEALILKKIHSGQSVDAIFTLYSDRDFLKIEDGELKIKNLVSKGKILHIPIITALPRWLNTFFHRADDTKPRFISSIIDYRNLMPFFPELMKILSWKLKRYGCRLEFILGTRDAETSSAGHRGEISRGQEKIILISSFAVAKNINIPDGWTSEIYFHSPMQYIRSRYDHYLGSMRGWKKRLFEYIVPRLRDRDSKKRSYDIMYANSDYTKEQIEKVYGLKDSEVIYPPLDECLFSESIVTVPDDYFLYINRLANFSKNIDTLIHLCNRFAVRLLIAGDGTDKTYLMSIAGPTIVFVGWIGKREDKIQLMKRAKGILNASYESFGMVTAESLLLGVPVFGYHGGATPELVDKKSGILAQSFDDTKKLDDAFTQFIQTQRDREDIQKRARIKFSSYQKFWNNS